VAVNVAVVVVGLPGVVGWGLDVVAVVVGLDVGHEGAQIRVQAAGDVQGDREGAAARVMVAAGRVALAVGLLGGSQRAGGDPFEQ
jgi:hypothetical protein